MNFSKPSSPKYSSAVSKQAGRLLAIVGPTGSGKTQAAIEVARQARAEVICADSRTIYRGMDIGTAKPTSEEVGLVPHYGLDLVDLNERYSVAEFQTYAYQKINEIWSRGNPVVLVGGSGMYLDAVLFGYRFRIDNKRPDIEAMDNSQLAKLVEQAYPGLLSTDDVKNTRRLKHILARGPSSDADRRHLKYDTKIIGISPKKSVLQERIIKRTQDMLSNGLVQEYKQLAKMWGGDCAPLKTIGYASVGRYLEGLLCFEQLEADIARDTMRLAKKQMTWFKRNSHIEWIDSPQKAVDLAIFHLKT